MLSLLLLWLMNIIKISLQNVQLVEAESCLYIKISLIDF